MAESAPRSTVQKLKLQLFHRLQRRHRDSWKRYWGAFQLYLAAKLSLEEFHALAEELLGPDKHLHNKFVVALLSTAFQQTDDDVQPPLPPEIQDHNGEGGGEAVTVAAGEDTGSERTKPKDPLLQIIKEEGARHACRQTRMKCTAANVPTAALNLLTKTRSKYSPICDAEKVDLFKIRLVIMNATTLPTTVRWIPDAEVSVCFGCQLLFDWVRRKHHCRYCGHVFCELCTPQRSLIREDQILTNPERKYLAVNAHNPQRVCDDCHVRLAPEQEELRLTMSHAVQQTEVKESGAQRFFNSPYSFTLREEIRKATYSVKNFTFQGVVKDQSIPLPLLTHAKGIAFLTVIKMGFVFTGRMGTGLVTARLPDGRWSAPSAIGTAGVGWGPQMGGEITDFVIILNTQRAVEAFCASGQVNLGAELGISAGPVGRVAAGSLEASASMDIAPCYSYSHSKGLFAGISLEGSVILSRPDINRSFYGKAVSVPELLGGSEPPPVAAAPLYEAIHSAMARSVFNSSEWRQPCYSQFLDSG
ncbi:hypothetical protein BBJ29_002395 [Phytophthora kernoviae]|uniref:FYVE-type domain-containing protein n=1 Tax=Phytophthora kernoviae TaxID=325452 RepID=A0A3F2RTN9_9STRA|nr:hypothetical protein BBP00_00003716 [Phytophthora kernoviae]RLN71760.1 hypothetical protein BBJ29_002395 [Phytophthora kernoviae]